MPDGPRCHPFGAQPLRVFVPAWHRYRMTARWPRLMKRKTAAEYCDLSEPAFEREVLAGRLPCAIKLGERDHWDKLALDKAISVLAGANDEPEYRRNLKERYGEAA
jgi:hypothetical protein